LIEWIFRPGDSIPAKIEEGLEAFARAGGLCMSANAFWVQIGHSLEIRQFDFREAES